MRSHGIGGVAREVGWLVVPALCLTAVMVFLGYVVTDLLPSTAIGRWDADVPRRLLEYRQHDAVSESKIITTLSATPTIVVLTVLAAIVIWHATMRWVSVAAVIVCAAVPLTIAISRVYRGMHYPTDVMAGGLLGALWLSVVIFYVRRHSAGGRRDAVVDADARLVKG